MTVLLIAAVVVAYPFALVGLWAGVVTLVRRAGRRTGRRVDPGTDTPGP